VLNRDAEKAGYEFQLAALNGNFVTREQMTANFLASAEFVIRQQLFVAGQSSPCFVPDLNAYNPRFLQPPDNARWVARLYWNVFGRCGSASDIEYHTSFLYGDRLPQISRTVTADRFLSGAEFKLHYGNRINFYIDAVNQRGIAPSLVEVNLAFIPINKYLDVNIDASGFPLVKGCPTTSTVQNCFKHNLLTGDPASFRPQGVTGVRFFLGAEWYSTALDAAGNIRPQWRSNLELFLADLKSAGIARITPTVYPGSQKAPPSAPVLLQNVVSCGTTKNLRFYEELPYGLEQQRDPLTGNLIDVWYPETCADGKDYEYAAANPRFVGWEGFLKVNEEVMAQAKNARLHIETLDRNATISCLAAAGRWLEESRFWLVRASWV